MAAGSTASVPRIFAGADDTAGRPPAQSTARPRRRGFVAGRQNTGRPAVSKMTRRAISAQRPRLLCDDQPPSALRPMAISTAPAGRRRGRSLGPVVEVSAQRACQRNRANFAAGRRSRRPTAGVVVAMSGSGVAFRLYHLNGGAPSSPPGKAVCRHQAETALAALRPLPAVRPGPAGAAASSSAAASVWGGWTSAEDGAAAAISASCAIAGGSALFATAAGTVAGRRNRLR